MLPTLSTYSGFRISYVAPDRSMISIVDVAHHLGMKCRFGGAVREFYSVAQHSVYCSWVVQGNWATKAATLLHDANEYLLPDVQRPIKANFPEWARIEDPLERALYLHFLGEAALAEVDWDALKAVDSGMGALESRTLCTDCSWAYDPSIGIHPDLNLRSIDRDFRPLPPPEAKAMFLAEFDRLFAKRPVALAS